MNISVLACNGAVSCRPDTTIGYEDRDFYVPDGAESLSFAPALFIRVAKAGKCIAPKFAERYFESVCPGVLLYVGGSRTPGIVSGGSDAAVVCPGAGALFDHSTVVPRTFYNKVTFTSAENVFELRLDGECIFTFSPAASDSGISDSGTAAAKISRGTIGMLESALSKVSFVMSQRIGDLVAVELRGPLLLTGKSAARARLSASWCDNPLFDREIIF